MAEIGRLNTLTVLRRAEQGLYLGKEGSEDILLPAAYVPENTKLNEEIEVFVYRDSEDRIIATTQTPHAMVGEFAALKVVATNQIGAFLDWGLLKDLLVPFGEQRHKMEVGKRYVVYVYLDEDTDRVVGTSKINKFLNREPATFEEGEEVDLLIYDQTELGYKAIINGTHSGVLYENEVFHAVEIGDESVGFIKKVREDGKIDLSFQPPGHGKVDDIAAGILQMLKEEGGFIAINDKSQAELIYATFGISKKNFKKAIGSLYKQRLIVLENDGIKLSAK